MKPCARHGATGLQRKAVGGVRRRRPADRQVDLDVAAHGDRTRVRAPAAAVDEGRHPAAGRAGEAREAGRAELLSPQREERSKFERAPVLHLQHSGGSQGAHGIGAATGADVGAVATLGGATPTPAGRRITRPWAKSSRWTPKRRGAGSPEGAAEQASGPSGLAERTAAPVGRWAIALPDAHAGGNGSGLAHTAARRSEQRRGERRRDAAASHLRGAGGPPGTMSRTVGRSSSSSSS